MVVFDNISVSMCVHYIAVRLKNNDINHVNTKDDII